MGRTGCIGGLWGELVVLVGCEESWLYWWVVEELVVLVGCGRAGCIGGLWAELVVLVGCGESWLYW